MFTFVQICVLLKQRFVLYFNKGVSLYIERDFWCEDTRKIKGFLSLFISVYYRHINCHYDPN